MAATPDSTVVIYYTGYVVQHLGANYLVPADSQVDIQAIASLSYNHPTPSCGLCVVSVAIYTTIVSGIGHPSTPRRSIHIHLFVSHGIVRQ